MLLSVNGSTTQVCSACLRERLAQPLPRPPVEHAPPCDRCSRYNTRGGCICPGPLTVEQAIDVVAGAALAAAKRALPGGDEERQKDLAVVLLSRARRA